MTDLDLFKVYLELGRDGYPPEWHKTIKHLVRAEAGSRCVRCLHPYVAPRSLNNGWSPCDDRCRHLGPARVMTTEGWRNVKVTQADAFGAFVYAVGEVEASWRILTVHHLNGVKADCRWWNLASLCQRCHLTIQGKVRLEREFVREHSDWFKPYAAGWYAWKYEHEYITREEAVARLDDLLAHELMARSLF